VGTPIRAARRGTVMAVIDGFTRCCLPREEAWKANAVYVRHRDGSVATYAHLREGIPVVAGQKVKGRQLLGYSGNTGWTTAPHLHFEVVARNAAGTIDDIPFRFRDGTPEGALPEEADFVLQRTPGNARLRLLEGAVVLLKGSPTPARFGEVLRLRVERVDPDGAVHDISGDPNVRYVTSTPWISEVNGLGRVAFRRDEHWRGSLAHHSQALVTMIYDDPESRLRGHADVTFELSEPAP